uniref:Uncharacterized protein n=1 Tax=Triticum urartu TaxID=4572 RepID=A0A8R7P7R2_TRIUA
PHTRPAHKKIKFHSPQKKPYIKPPILRLPQLRFEILLLHLGFCCLPPPPPPSPPASTMALPNQNTVDYPSFKLVIVGDGGTGEPPSPLTLVRCGCGRLGRDLSDAPACCRRCGEIWLSYQFAWPPDGI